MTSTALASRRIKNFLNLLREPNLEKYPLCSPSYVIHAIFSLLCEACYEKPWLHLPTSGTLLTYKLTLPVFSFLKIFPFKSEKYSLKEREKYGLQNQTNTFANFRGATNLQYKHNQCIPLNIFLLKAHRIKLNMKLANVKFKCPSHGRFWQLVTNNNPTDPHKMNSRKWAFLREFEETTSWLSLICLGGDPVRMLNTQKLCRWNFQFIL